MEFHICCFDRKIIVCDNSYFTYSPIKHGNLSYINEMEEFTCIHLNDNTIKLINDAIPIHPFIFVLFTCIKTDKEFTSIVPKKVRFNPCVSGYVANDIFTQHFCQSPVVSPYVRKAKYELCSLYDVTASHCNISSFSIYAVNTMYRDIIISSRYLHPLLFTSVMSVYFNMLVSSDTACLSRIFIYALFTDIGVRSYIKDISTHIPKPIIGDTDKSCIDSIARNLHDAIIKPPHDDVYGNFVNTMLHSCIASIYINPSKCDGNIKCVSTIYVLHITEKTVYKLDASISVEYTYADIIWFMQRLYKKQSTIDISDYQLKNRIPRLDGIIDNLIHN